MTEITSSFQSRTVWKLLITWLTSQISVLFATHPAGDNREISLWSYLTCSPWTEKNNARTCVYWKESSKYLFSSCMWRGYPLLPLTQLCFRMYVHWSPLLYAKPRRFLNHLGILGQCFFLGVVCFEPHSESRRIFRKEHGQCIKR